LLAAADNIRRLAANDQVQELIRTANCALAQGSSEAGARALAQLYEPYGGL
jgi:hypothetical protein